MKKNSWKTFLSVVLLLTMLVSMLPSAAFAEETQSPDAQTAAEETVKVEENKDTAKEEAKTENKDTAKEEAKTENKDAVKEETKTEDKEEVKPETKTEVKEEVKPETKTEVKEEVKPETKTEVKDETKDETKDEVKDETKTEDKEKVKDEAEEETKDETKEYSDAVKAFLAAVAAISVPEDVSALSEDEIMGLLAQIDAAGACYEELNPEEQALDEVVAAVADMENKMTALGGYGIDTLAAGEKGTLRLSVGCIGFAFYNPSTGKHSVNSISISPVIVTMEEAGGLNPSPCYAEASFEGSNESGWNLVVTIVVGNYTTVLRGSDVANAKVLDKNMQNATGKFTFGFSYQHGNPNIGGNITVMGASALPKTDTTLVYDANGGVNPPAKETKRVPVNESSTSFTVKGQENMTRPGYTFAGWTENAAGTGTVYNANDTITVAAGTTKTLYAKWEKIPEQVEITLTYDPNGGNGNQRKDTMKVTEGESYTFTIKSPDAIGITAKDGYEFTGWNTRADGKGDAVTGTITISASTTIYAQWKKLPTTATVIYHANGGTATTDPVTREVEPGQYMIENPAQVGFTAPNGKQFLYWTTAAQEGDGVTAHYPDTKVNLAAGETLELWAQWETGSTEPPTPDTPNWDGLEITKVTDPETATVAPGEELTYTITVWNSSDYTMENIVVSDTLPSEVDYVSCSGGLTYDSNTRTLTATIDSLDPGRTIFGIAVKVVDVSSDTITNTAKITHAECNGNVWDGVKEDTVSIGVVQPIEISKTVDKTTAAPGDTLTYTITVTNNTSDAVRLNVIDTLPQNITVDEATISNGGRYNSAERAISWSVELSTKGNLELSFEATIDADFAGDVIAANRVQTTFNDVVYIADSDPVEVMPLVEMEATVTVKFVGLEGEATFPTSYKLRGDRNNEFFKNGVNIALTMDPTNKTATYTEKVSAVPGRDYTVRFTQSGYDVFGYSCDGKAAVEKTVTATDNGINVEIVINYTKGGKTTVPVKVTVEFIGLDDKTPLPEAYTLTGDDTNEILKGKIELGNEQVTGGYRNRMFSGTVDVVLGQQYMLKFTHTGYEVPRYDCKLIVKEQRQAIVSDATYGLNVRFQLVYTKTDAEKTEMPVAVNVKFVGLDKDTKLPAYTLTGAPTNEFLNGTITLTKDETADTAVYTDKIQAVPGKAYDLKFAQTGFNVDGYKCDATAAVSKTVTADAKKGVEVTITLNYTKTDAEKTEMPVAVNVKFVGLDKDTKLPAYTLTGAPTNEFLNGAIALTKDETADTMTYTGKIQAVPGKAYGLSFIQSGFDVAGFICDASVVVTKSVTADAKTGVVVDLVLTYTKINWGGLTITKTADKTYATPGSYVKYTITVTNNTGVDLTNVNVLDYLPSTVRYSSSFGGYNSGTSSWTIARLADGKSATATIRVRLNSGLSTGTKIENTAYVTGVTIDGQEYVFENLWLNDTAIVIVTDGKGAPKTGDESNLGLWIAVMAASLACAGAAIVIYKKRRTGND